MKKCIALFLVLSLVLAVGGVLSGCTQPSSTDPGTATPAATTPAGGAATPAGVEPTPAGEPTVYRIGLLYPYSGPAASVAIQYEIGHKAYLNYYNEVMGGSPKGPLEIEWVKADTESNADVAVAAFERIVNDIDFLLGVYNSAVAVAVAPVAEKYKVPFLNTGSLSDRAIELPTTYCFRAFVGDFTLVRGHRKLFDWFMSDYALSNYGQLYVADETGVNTMTGIRNWMADTELPILCEERLSPGSTTDMSGAVQKLKEANPDICFVYFSPAEAVLANKTWKEYKCLVPMLSQGAGHFDPNFQTNVGPGGADGTITQTTWVPDASRFSPHQEQALEWEQRMNQMLADEGHNMTITEAAVTAWMNMGVVMDALERAESYSRDDVAKAMKETDIDYEHPCNMYVLYSGIRFVDDPANNRYNVNDECACMYVQMQDDEWKLIFLGAVGPVEGATFNFPTPPYRVD